MFFFDQNINVEEDVAVANDFRLLQMSFANGLLMTSKRASKCSWLLQMTNGFAHGKCSWLLMANFALLTTMFGGLVIRKIVFACLQPGKCFQSPGNEKSKLRGTNFI